MQSSAVSTSDVTISSRSCLKAAIERLYLCALAICCSSSAPVIWASTLASTACTSISVLSSTACHSSGCAGCFFASALLLAIVLLLGHPHVALPEHPSGKLQGLRPLLPARAPA